MFYRAIYILIIILFSVDFSVAAQEKHEAVGRPNFLVIFTDDQTYRAMGYNDPLIQTPHLDSLAAEGLVFNHAYVASPICAASRASLYTGVFPQRHGVIALNSKAFGAYCAGGNRSQLTLGSKLTAAGYETALFGKSHLGDPTRFGFKQGKECADGKALAASHHFLQECAKTKRPFLLCLTPHKPHVPLRPDKKWLDLYETGKIPVARNFRESPEPLSINNQGVPQQTLYRDSDYRNNYKNLPAGPPRNEEVIREFAKAYYATISQLDDEMGHLIARLKKLHLYENTLIIYLSDNGYFLGNHGLGNKITMHEESVRVPMFVHWPAKNSRWNGVRTDALVSSLDVYPTIMALAGLRMEKHLQGKSLVPILDNPQMKVRDYVFSECIGVGGKPGEGHRMVRSQKWKYVLTGANEEYLFNERDDPFELNNAAKSPEHHEIRLKMRQLMAQWMQANHDRKHPHFHSPRK